MLDKLSLTSHSPQDTAQIAGSLSRSLYAYPCDVLLVGPLGSGKTIFAKGFAEALGVQGDVVSPTFALENRLETKSGQPFFHLDLYRLTGNQAKELLMQTDGLEGIRVIEWPEKAGADRFSSAITITFDEEKDDRTLTIEWKDVAIPTDEEIETWRNDVLLQPHIREHCDAVAKTALLLADHLVKRNIVVRKDLIRAAARVHDLLRFIDFTKGGAPTAITDTPEEMARWAEVRTQFDGLHHEEACAAFLREKHYPAVAHIVATHGVHLSPDDSATIEQILLYYADKRCNGSQVVTIDERFEDFRRRYGDARKKEADLWMKHAKEIETSLFPDGAPTLL